ncbi:MAG TPA: squalene/phytoene synthase family protein, partial [Bacteroidia bacterium]|nr:squalene/phytoene synthase family protein [Bacteroidia bacterium]
FADEIVDSFHGFNKVELLAEFKEETWKALDRKISLNPILNSFQRVVHEYNISRDLIARFLQSMESDLTVNEHSKDSYNQYIYGSAEVVGLMCLSVFTENNVELYQQLKQPAMKLGAAFQKINFLRDIKNDYSDLGRIYFPGIDFNSFTEEDKKQIELEIKQDLEEALIGIKKLPKSSKLGVYVAYIYYENLFNKIVDIPSASILMQRVRISNPKKMSLLFTSYLKHNLSLI